MAKQTDDKGSVPQLRQFLSAEDFSFLEKKAATQLKSLEDAAAAIGNITASGTENRDGAIDVSKDAGIPIDIDTVIAAEFSKLKKDAQIKEVSNIVDNGQNIVKTTIATTTPPLKITSKPDTSFLIPKSDLKVMVSQDSALRTLFTSTTQKFRPDTTPKAQEVPVRTTHAPNADKITNSISTPAAGGFSSKTPVTEPSDVDTTASVLTSVFEKTPQSIPLMVGGGLALFIIVLLVAIVVLLLRLKSKKGDISMRNGE